MRAGWEQAVSHWWMVPASWARGWRTLEAQHREITAGRASRSSETRPQQLARAGRNPIACGQQEWAGAKERDGKEAGPSRARAVNRSFSSQLMAPWRSRPSALAESASPERPRPPKARCLAACPTKGQRPLRSAMTLNFHGLRAVVVSEWQQRH